MFSHMVLGTNDPQKAKTFYDATLGVLGAAPGTMWENGAITYFHAGYLFMVRPPLDGKVATHANGGTLGFIASSPEQVEAWHAAGLANGGTTCENPPGYRDQPTGRVYLAYLRDPTNNKIVAVYRPDTMNVIGEKS
jgi:catechol 2,3-dioxygenase-like lactoylglutathione lyase family enzyme